MGDTESPVFVAGTVLVDVIVIADLILACILVTDTSSMFGIAVLVNSHVTTHLSIMTGTFRIRRLGQTSCNHTCLIHWILLVWRWQDIEKAFNDVIIPVKPVIIRCWLYGGRYVTCIA